MEECTTKCMMHIHTHGESIQTWGGWAFHEAKCLCQTIHWSIPQLSSVSSSLNHFELVFLTDLETLTLTFLFTPVSQWADIRKTALVSEMQQAWTNPTLTDISNTHSQMNKAASLLRQRAMGSSIVTVPGWDPIVRGHLWNRGSSYVAPTDCKSKRVGSWCFRLWCVLQPGGNSSDCKNTAMHRGTTQLD